MNAFPIRHRRNVLIICIGVVLLAILPLFQTTINSDLESYMPDTMQSKQNNRKIAQYFTTAETILLVVEAQNSDSTPPDILSTNNLRILQQLSDTLQQLPEVNSVHSLFKTNNILHQDGDMIIEPSIPYIPKTKAEREQLRNNLKNNDLACGLVVSNDFRHALLMLEVNRDSTSPDADAILVNQLKNVISDITNQQTNTSEKLTSNLSYTPNHSSAKVYMTGQPYLRYDANRKIGRDILVLLPLGLLIMLAFLWLSFRDIKSVLLPFSVVVFSIVISMSLIPAFGWELSLIGVLIPIMMIAIANNYGVYVIVRYQELSANRETVSIEQLSDLPNGFETPSNLPASDSHHLLSQAITYLQKPVWLCGLTTVAGTLGLTAHLLIPARQMGVITSLGIAAALIMSLTFIPAVMSYFKQKRKPFVSSSLLPGLLLKTGRRLTNHPRRPLYIAVLMLAICIAGATRVTVAPDSTKILPEDHEFNKSIRIADEQFGGSKILQIMIEGDAREPSLLGAIDSVARQLEHDPLVGHAASLATMIRKMHEGSGSETQSTTSASLPDSREAIAQYLELYGMSADVADYERFIDFNYSRTLLTVQYRSASLKEVNALISKIKTELDSHHLKYVIGGISLIDKEISESVRKGQFSSLAVALLAILVLLGIIFRSITAGLIGGIPLVFAVICTFGIMGWSGIELDLVTALISSISIGLGVDFTIHIFWRMKHELSLNGKDWNSAVINTLAGTGRGITINAFSVMLGFSVLLFSSFPFVQSFGLLIILSLLLCLISALFIIPVICILLKPSFLLHTK